MAIKAKILIVEDSLTQSTIIADIVKRAGHSPAVYNELNLGITQILTAELPDLVLLDLKLLDKDGKQVADGFQICREIKRFPKKPGVIVVSAEGDEEAVQWAILQGADAFIQKPFAAPELSRVISDVLSKAA